MVVEYCVNRAPENCVLRLNIGPSQRIIQLPDGYQFAPGKGVTLSDGRDAVMCAYGPVVLHEALLAAEILAGHGFGLQVVNMPWLNRFDTDWLRDVVAPRTTLYVLEDHGPVGGLGDGLLNALVANNLLDSGRFEKFAVEGYPACGTPAEALKYHALDGKSLARWILSAASQS